MLWKICLLSVLSSMSIRINCETFCNHPYLDSALTVDNDTYLFRNYSFWVFDATKGLLTPNSSRINNTFKVTYKHQGVEGELQKIGALFWTQMLTERGDVDPARRLLFVFHEEDYFFLAISERCQSRRCFVALNSGDANSIPSNLNFFGGRITDRFPNKIDATLRVNHSLLLFHDRFVRYIELNSVQDMKKEWPPREKPIEILFDGSLKSVNKIDSIFEMTLTPDIVMTSGSKYCRFNKNQIDIKPNITKTLNIKCEWKETKSLFECDKPTESTLSVVSTDSPKEWTSNEANTKVTDHLTDTEMTSDLVSPKPDKNKNFVVIVVIAFFSLMIILILGLVIGIAYCMAVVPQKKYGMNGALTGPMGSLYSQSSNSMASIVTIDSNTGESIRNK